MDSLVIKKIEDLKDKNDKKVVELKNAVNSRNPEYILEKINLQKFIDLYENKKKLDKEVLEHSLKTKFNTMYIIEILIIFYVLSKKDSIVWPKKRKKINSSSAIIRPKTSDQQRLAQLFRNRPTKTRGLSMPEFSETTVVTAGPRKGEKFQLAYAPYLRKPMELMSPGSIIQQIFLMFPAQSAKSVFVQLCCGFYGLEVPSEMIYATSDLNQARNVSQRRLEVLFRSIGLKFRTQSENKGSRRTGDVLLSKEFDGGNIDVGTAGSSAFLASETKRIGIGDELDRWKLSLGVEGSPWAQLYARLKAWGDEKKAVGVSTPTDEDVSLIYALYLTGTQDEWWMHCPLCGAPQILEVKNKSGFGLDYKTRSEKIVSSSIVYVCKKCAES